MTYIVGEIGFYNLNTFGVNVWSIFLRLCDKRSSWLGDIDAGKRWLARTGEHDCYKIRACLESCMERRLVLSVNLTGNVT